jgi:hypothetical protein
MTIDEHIGVIEDLKSAMSVCMPEPEKTEICTSLGEAIDTMRKYQKLERALDKIRTEIAEYGSIWVDYKITGRRDKDIEQLVSDVLSQAKKQVLDVIDKYRGESEDI